MRDIVFTKTAAGLQEIQTRQLRLAPRLRSLLVLIDGKQRAQALLDTLKPMGIAEEHFQELRDMGLIEAPNGASVSAPVVEEAVLAPPPTANEAVNNHHGADLQMELYRACNQAIGALGLRGFKLQLQLEKAATPDDYRALCASVATALRGARGDVEADAFLARSKVLLGG